MIPPTGIRQRFEQITPVSDQTWDRLTAYASHLAHWQKTLNLVAPSTLPVLWERHLLDSWQTLPLVSPDLSGSSATPGPLVDFGSGAGLPGLVLAIAGVPGVHLIESNHRKTAFLRFAAEQTGASCRIISARAESVREPALTSVPVITARALAALPDLLHMTLPFCGPETRLLFPKGRHWREEVEAAEQRYSFSLTIHESVTDPEAVILELQSLTER